MPRELVLTSTMTSLQWEAMWAVKRGAPRYTFNERVVRVLMKKGLLRRSLTRLPCYLDFTSAGLEMMAHAPEQED